MTYTAIETGEAIALDDVYRHLAQTLAFNAMGLGPQSDFE